MSFSDVVKVRISKNDSLGAFLGKMRVWLDREKIYQRQFTTCVDARGYTVTIGFETIAAADRFRQEFRSNISDEHISQGQGPSADNGPAASAVPAGRHGAA